MRSWKVGVASIGLGALTLCGACARREVVMVAPPAGGEVGAPVAPPPPPWPPSALVPSPAIAGDGGAGGAAAAPAVGAGAAAGSAGSHHRGAPAPAAEGGSHGAIGKVKVQGSVPRGDVERVLREGVPKLKACRAGGAGGKGQVDLELTIGEQGWATLAEVKRTTLGGGDPEMCLVKTLRALRFLRPSDGKDTTVSFVLRFD